MTLHPIIPAYRAGAGSASLESHELLGEEGLPEYIKILLGKKKEKGSLGRQPAMFTT